MGTPTEAACSDSQTLSRLFITKFKISSWARSKIIPSSQSTFLSPVNGSCPLAANAVGWGQGTVEPRIPQAQQLCTIRAPLRPPSLSPALCSRFHARPCGLLFGSTSVSAPSAGTSQGRGSGSSSLREAWDRSCARPLMIQPPSSLGHCGQQWFLCASPSPNGSRFAVE